MNIPKNVYIQANFLNNYGHKHYVVLTKYFKENITGLIHLIQNLKSL